VQRRPETVLDTHPALNSLACATFDRSVPAATPFGYKFQVISKRLQTAISIRHDTVYGEVPPQEENGAQSQKTFHRVSALRSRQVEP
jgi:hypothetical protein